MEVMKLEVDIFLVGNFLPQLPLVSLNSSGPNCKVSIVVGTDHRRAVGGVMFG